MRGRYQPCGRAAELRTAEQIKGETISRKHDVSEYLFVP
jgi:hypothetical protein